MRGQLTEEVLNKSKEVLGREITTEELRLIPYVQYCLVNNSHLNFKRISPEEVKIIDDWNSSGWMNSKESNFSVTKEFWDNMNELLWISYVGQS